MAEEKDKDSGEKAASAAKGAVSKPSEKDQAKAKDPDNPDSPYPSAPEGGVDEVTPDIADDSVINEFGDLSRSELVRIRTFVERALGSKGHDSEYKPDQSPTTLELAGNRPADDEQAAEIGAKDAAKKVDSDEDEILDYTVRQAVREPSGERYGKKYLVVVHKDGSKKAVEL